MFKFGDKDYTDQEVEFAYWERVKKRMDSCRRIAKETLQKMQRDAFYRVEYRVDPGIKTVYVHFSEEEYNIIKKALEDDIALNGKYEGDDERKDFIHHEASKWDVDWSSYIPDEDWHWAGGDPIICDVNLDDYKYCCTFMVTYIKSGNDEEKSRECLNIELSDDDYINLLASRLFDPQLCFSDLHYLNPELFNQIDTMVNKAHCDYYVEMQDINEAAKNIMDSHEEYKGLPELDGNIFSPIMINEILNHKDQYDDDASLLKAFRLAVM